MPRSPRVLALLVMLCLAVACSDSGETNSTDEPNQSEPILFEAPDGAILRIERDRLRFILHARDGGLVLRGTPGGFALERAGKQISLGSVSEVKRSERSLHLLVESPAGLAKVDLHWRDSRTLELAFVPPADAVFDRLCQSIELVDDEAIYGLSERPHDAHPVPYFGVPWNELWPRERGSLSRRGERVEMFVRPTIALYAPFFVSSQGYGHFVEGTWPGHYDIGKSDPSKLELCFESAEGRSAELRAAIFLGEPREVLDSYTALTGRPFVPPEWAFLHWRWRGELELGDPVDLDGAAANAQLAEDLLAYEEHSIPPGVYLIDRPWSPGEFGFESFRWDRERFPDPEAMRAALDRRGWRLALWSAAFAVGENLEIAREQGYLAPGSDLVLDLTHDAAREWWLEEHAEFAKRWDVSGWKLDRGEEFIPSRRQDVWADGRTGREVHNAYPVLQAEVYHESLIRARGPRDHVVLARAGYSGAQRSMVAWGGDTPASTLAGRGWGTDLGLRMAILSLLRAGFLGYPIWGSDTGGYYEFRDRDVFARWLEFSCFTPIMEIGGIGPHAPWAMPPDGREDAEMVAIYRRYVQLHHDLAPLVSAFAEEYGSRGVPIARALVFDHPEDPRVRDLWDEFLFGNDLLVAPIWRTGERSRQVYLPDGAWEDFWEPSVQHRGPIVIEAGGRLDRIPVFVRAGADIPGRERARNDPAFR